jgi:hypothetical protein
LNSFLPPQPFLAYPPPQYPPPTYPTSHFQALPFPPPYPAVSFPSVPATFAPAPAPAQVPSDLDLLSKQLKQMLTINS